MPQAFGRFYEPFLGSAAMFLAMRPPRAVLSDLNKELINFYEELAGNWRELYDAMASLTNDSETYYRMRIARPRTPFRSAVRFFYLNRTCFNGIFRTNLRGEFNVPFGNNGRSILPDPHRFQQVAAAFRKSTLVAGDFEAACFNAAKGDLVFFDPPYTVSHENNGFIKYNANLFAWRDQERLKSLVDALTERGTFVVLTNACHDSIRRLYRAYAIYPFERSSTLSAVLHGRRNVTELIIKNF